MLSYTNQAKFPNWLKVMVMSKGGSNYASSR